MFCSVLSSLVLPISSKEDTKFLFWNFSTVHMKSEHIIHPKLIIFSSLYNISPSTTASHNLGDVRCCKDLYDFSGEILTLTLSEYS